MKHEKNTVPTTLLNAELAKMSEKDQLKARSKGLFYVDDGNRKIPFASELDALTTKETKTITGAADAIAKHFGIYKQRERNASGGKTGDYIFMVRVKNPGGGELTAMQWIGLDQATELFADKTLRLTSREGIQYHFVYGSNLAPLIRHLNTKYRDQSYHLTTLGACGDVNRNTMCSPIDDLDPDLPLDSLSLVHAIERELAPRSSAYTQIFLSDDKGRTVAPLTVEEPIYGAQYLPRKFKVGIAHPHDNSIDLLTQDVGFMPAVNDKVAKHYDLYTGGGLGTTHNLPETKQLLGIYLGRVAREQVVDTVRSIAILQKEQGERKNRRQARWKYTLRRLGVDFVKTTLRERFGIRLIAADPLPIPEVRYHYGWHQEASSKFCFYYGLPVENGRLQNTTATQMRTAISKIVEQLNLGVRITPNQDLLLCHVPANRRRWVEQLLRKYGVKLPDDISNVRKLAMACPAKPTCGLAMTEAERILPHYILELEKAGLGEVDVIIRMAGCPNVCSRSPTAEIGIYGYGKNNYVIQVGGARDGTRIAKVLYTHEYVSGEQIVPILKGLVQAVRDNNPENLSAGEFLYHTPVNQLQQLVGI